MNTVQKLIISIRLVIPAILILLLISYNGQAQDEPVSKDTVAVENTGKKDYIQRRNDIKVYAGLTLSDMIDISQYESSFATGFNLGIAYRQGRFAYWEVGLRYNGSVILLENSGQLQEESLVVNQLEMPVVVGINLLSAVRRVLGLRLFGGVSPGLVVGIKDNDLGFEREDFNSFQLSGNLGAGVDIAFFFIEVGYQYGFIELVESEKDSHLSQIYLNLGVRF